MTISRATGEELTRVEELTLRTSQMNATGVHYPDAALRALMSDPQHEVLLLEKRPYVWHLKLLATSCRVVSFGAAAAILRWLIDQAASAGVHLAADFRATDRNRMMEVAYRFAGFTDQACPCTADLPAPVPGPLLAACADRPRRGRAQAVPARSALRTPPWRLVGSEEPAGVAVGGASGPRERSCSRKTMKSSTIRLPRRTRSFRS